ncbi:MAG: type II secretion system protein [Armatimonadetes bacterium]|nr:type II secretion system protein [Armatimonadota bacterium]
MCPRFADSRGFTLPEVLVAAVLTVLFFGMVFAVLIPGARSYVRGAVRADLSQQAALALKALTEDLEATAPALVGVTAQDRFPVILSMTRLAGVESSGERVWEDRVVLYCWDREKARLLRREVEASLDPRRPRRLTDIEAAALAAGSAREERIMARDLDLFEVAPADPGPVEVRLRLQRSGAHQTKPEVVELARKIEPSHSL